MDVGINVAANNVLIGGSGRRRKRLGRRRGASASTSSGTLVYGNVIGGNRRQRCHELFVGGRQRAGRVGRRFPAIFVGGPLVAEGISLLAAMRAGSLQI
jgi:hypothetical protein